MAVFHPSGNYVLDSMKPCDLSSCTKREIKEYFENSFDLYETLFLGLADESAFYKSPDSLRLPLIFYFGHTAVFYVNKLVLSGLLKERINFDYETLFETGVDEMSWDDTENYRMGGSFVWPTVSDVASYRKRVRQVMLDVIDKTPLKLPVTQESQWWAVFMGMEHERIHFETSSVLIRQMPLELVTKPPGWKNGPMTAGGPVLSNPLIQMPEQAVNMGKPENFPSYGWDNEYGEWNVKVPSFKASKYLVTNGEYLEFVKDGGYENPNYWTKEGWQWKNIRQFNHPSFWVCSKGCKSGCGTNLGGYSHCDLATNVDHNGFIAPIDVTDNGIVEGGSQNGAFSGITPNGLVKGFMNGQQHGVQSYGGHVEVSPVVNGVSKSPYKYRAMFELLEMPMAWPVEVNYHEVKAFCAWKGPEYRLPTEAEHHVMRGPQKPAFLGTACDIIYQDTTGANINMVYGSSTPVNMYPPTEAGFCDVFGNVWEWVEDHVNGFNQFKAHPLYDDFSTPYFDGRHNMIMGGSWVSTGDEASRFVRSFFRRHFFQHLGFRVAQSVKSSPPVRLVGTPVFVLGVGIEDISVTLPGVDENSAYVSTTNRQYLDDDEEFLYSEVLCNYGDLLGVDSAGEECKQLAHCCAEAAHKYNCPMKKALEIMCSLGRFSYELTKQSVEEVIAIDHSGRLLDAALKIQQGETLEIKNANDFSIVNIPLTAIKANFNDVSFQQFTWLPNEIGVYDLIVMRSLDRLTNPKAWLIRLWELIDPNGLVVIKPSNDWDISSLRAVLEKRFTLLENRKVAIKREGLRKSDMCHSSVTIWRLKH